jgi:probable rRNA maturation factor
MADVNIQVATEHTELPSHDQLTLWCVSALEPAHVDDALAIRIVDEDEIQSLNAQFRGKDSPTNVLSFPSQLPAELELKELGDIVICAPVVEREASEQKKTSYAHWAHMIVHGTLHLQGYDHNDDEEAEVMEQKEIAILAQFDIPNPY